MNELVEKIYIFTNSKVLYIYKCLTLRLYYSIHFLCPKLFGKLSIGPKLKFVFLFRLYSYILYNIAITKSGAVT